MLKDPDSVCQIILISFKNDITHLQGTLPSKGAFIEQDFSFLSCFTYRRVESGGKQMERCGRIVSSSVVGG